LAPWYRILTHEPAPRRTVEALAQDVLELATTVGFGRFSFCGLSLGAMVGMRLAISAPERIDRLVLACTSARLGTPRAPRPDRGRCPSGQRRPADEFDEALLAHLDRSTTRTR
jgi:pimeloyl-ACP methyl ester carboxylesterase